MEIQYSQFKINHLSNTPSTKAAGGKIFSGVFTQGRQGTTQGQEDFEFSWYLCFQQGYVLSSSSLGYLVSKNTVDPCEEKGIKLLLSISISMVLVGSVSYGLSCSTTP